jgi:transposase-like protein
MKNSEFKKKIKDIDQVNSPQLWELREVVGKLDYRKKVTITLEEDADVKCGHCGSTKFIKNGRKCDLQRYKCKTCNKNFNILTGSPLAKLRKKGRWLDFCECLKKGYSVRKSAELVKVDKNTSFKWRHRFLTNSNKLNATELNGISEIQETSFKFSEKGARPKLYPEKAGEDVYVITSQNRNMYVNNALVEKLTPDNIFVFNKELYKNDSLLLFNKMTLKNKFSKLQVEKSRMVVNEKICSKNNLIHIQNANAYNFDLHDWMIKFRGVATKYLHNYLSWFRELRELLMEPPIELILVRARSVEKHPYHPIIQTKPKNEDGG